MSNVKDSKLEQPMKFTIILKPEVLAEQQLNKRRKQKKLASKNGTVHPVPESLEVYSLGKPDCKFNVKLRDVLDTLTFSIQDYIIYNLDNESTSDQYKGRLRTGLAKIRDDFIGGRSNSANPVQQITQLSNK
jgi:hypothetical protein